MTPTNEQIIAEAIRRRKERGMEGIFLADFIIEVMREGWTPPEPVVDPDVLAFRDWASKEWPLGFGAASSGRMDTSGYAKAYLAGARMAREQERERADMPIGMAGALVDRCQRLMHSLPPGVHAQWDAKWGIDALCRAVEAEIAKYRGEA